MCIRQLAGSVTLATCVICARSSRQCVYPHLRPFVLPWTATGLRASSHSVEPHRVCRFAARMYLLLPAFILPCLSARGLRTIHAGLSVEEVILNPSGTGVAKSLQYSIASTYSSWPSGPVFRRPAFGTSPERIKPRLSHIAIEGRFVTYTRLKTEYL